MTCGSCDNWHKIGTEAPDGMALGACDALLEGWELLCITKDDLPPDEPELGITIPVRRADWPVCVSYQRKEIRK